MMIFVTIPSHGGECGNGREGSHDDGCSRRFRRSIGVLTGESSVFLCLTAGDFAVLLCFPPVGLTPLKLLSSCVVHPWRIGEIEAIVASKLVEYRYEVVRVACRRGRPYVKTALDARMIRVNPRPQKQALGKRLSLSGRHGDSLAQRRQAECPETEEMTAEAVPVHRVLMLIHERHCTACIQRDNPGAWRNRRGGARALGYGLLAQLQLPASGLAESGGRALDGDLADTRRVDGCRQVGAQTKLAHSQLKPKGASPPAICPRCLHNPLQAGEMLWPFFPTQRHPETLSRALVLGRQCRLPPS